LKSAKKGTKVERRKIEKVNQFGFNITYIEMSQEISLCSYLKQTKLSFLFFYKIREQEVLPGGVLVPVGGGRRWRKGMGG
jgi:hypothetical protein